MSSTDWEDTSLPYLAPAPAGAPDAWQQEAAAHGRSGSQRLLFAGEVPAPAPVARHLEIATGENVVVRRRLVLLDGRPVELAYSYFPTAIARGTELAQPRKIRGGAVSLLARLGHHGRTAQEYVTARQPSKDECEALGIDETEWVMTVHRLVTGDTGTPIEVTVMTMLARGRTLKYTVEIG